MPLHSLPVCVHPILDGPLGLVAGPQWALQCGAVPDAYDESITCSFCPVPRTTPGGGGDRRHLLQQLTALVSEFESTSPSNGRAAKKLREELLSEARRLEWAAIRLDPTLRPRNVFDPSDPRTSGRIVALSMIAQPRHSLADLPAFYGAGVYALYYNGPYEAYLPLSGTEQPIYVGKADPKGAGAKDAVSQGTSLYDRLNEHRRNIMKATSTLDIGHFECRFLIVQSGYQDTAENFLIDFFRPIWNSETRICFGLGKHGDSAGTRANKRSPWDTLHPGRTWALPLAEDQKPKTQIFLEIAEHLERVPPHPTLEKILEDFLGDLGQLASTEFTTSTGVPVPVDTPPRGPDPAAAQDSLF
jgi:hypothetical protein